MTDINAAPGSADPFSADQSAFTAFTILEVNPEYSLLVVPYEFIILDISFFLQNAAEAGLDPGGGNVHLVESCFLRSPNSVQEIAYWIRYNFVVLLPPATS